MGSGISVIGNGLSEECAISSLIANLLDANYKIPEKYSTIESFYVDNHWKVEITGYGVYNVAVMNGMQNRDNRIYTAYLEYIAREV